MNTSTRPRLLAGVTAVLATALLASACSGSSSSNTPATAAASTTTSSEPITLSINVFGDAFPASVYRAYEKAHPNITIKENRADYGAHHTNLQAHLTAGAGAGDVEAIEVGQIAGFLGEGDKFVNFKDQGVDLSQWGEAKVKQSTATDGSVIGLGTDTGGLAVCYRKDLFQAAGLPTDRTKVSGLWKSWEDYVAAGDTFVAKTPNVKWYDAAGHLFTGILAQQQNTFYDADGQLIAKTNPAIKQAWDLSVKSIQAKQSAALAEFSPEWNSGFVQGKFATITCPAWMLAYIRNNAPATKGKWDVATVPGGSGNWGGSWLTVPKQGKHTQEATDLVEYLTSEANALAVLKEYGNFPSLVDTWTKPEVTGLKDAFFSEAPVGEIFPASFKNLPPQTAGPQSGVIGVAFNNALNKVEQGADPDEAWNAVQKDIDAAAG